MNKKTIYIYLGIGIFLFFVYLVLVFVFFHNQTQTTIQPVPTPTQSPKKPQISIYPFESIGTVFDQAKKVHLTDANDIALRKEIIGTPGTTMKTIYDTTAFRIQYVPKTDVIMVQLLAEDIVKARKESIQWFMEKGFSKTSICNLRLVYYSNWERAGLPRSTKPRSGMQFYPSPDGC